MGCSRQRNLFWVPFRGKTPLQCRLAICLCIGSITNPVHSLDVVKPDITSSTIIGTSCAILILLFLIQPLGTAKIGSAFAPIVIIWLLFNFSFGIYVGDPPIPPALYCSPTDKAQNLVHFDHSVLKAFSPYFAGAYFVRNKTDGWKSLGGILLAFTGVEALFADLGAFTRRYLLTPSVALQPKLTCLIVPSSSRGCASLFRVCCWR